MSFVSNSGRRGWLGSAGVTSLELALVLLPFLFLMTAVFDLGRYLFTVQSMVTLMTEAARYSKVYPDQTPLCGVNTWPNTATVAPLLDPTQVNLCITSLNPTYGVMQVQVTVTYPFTAATPGLSTLDGTLTETATYSY
jgi:hypothetical protein